MTTKLITIREAADLLGMREYTDRWRADGGWFEIVKVREAKGTALAMNGGGR